MAPPPEQKKRSIGLSMAIARKSWRWRYGDRCRTKSIAMLTHIIRVRQGMTQAVGDWMGEHDKALPDENALRDAAFMPATSKVGGVAQHPESAANEGDRRVGPGSAMNYLPCE